MPIQVTPVAGDPVLPARVDVAVIGGGVIGVSCALWLAQKGIAVALCEKGEIAAEQSGRNWGWTRVMGRDPAEIPLGLASLRLWREMNRTVGAETGFRQCGIAYLAETPKLRAEQEAWLEHARSFQIGTRLLSPDDVDRLIPGSTRRWAGGIFTDSDGRAEPFLAVPAMAEAARRAGAAILTRCAVRGLDLEGGRVAGVVTERGRIACTQAVLAGGAWSRLFCGPLGLDLPALRILGSVFRSQPLDGLPEISVGAGSFAFRKRLDGGYSIAQRNANLVDIVPDSFRLLGDFLGAALRQRHELRLRIGRQFIDEWRLPRRWRLDEVSPFERVRTLDPAPSPAILEGGRRRLVEAFPAFRDVRIADSWGGLIDVTPDAVPVIGAVGSIPGFHLATGFSGHGFGIGPGAGRLIADLVAGDAPIVDPTPYRLERFSRLKAAA